MNTFRKIYSLSIHFRSLLEGIEFACGMPKLHSREDLIECAEAQSLHLIKVCDLSEESGQTFYYCFTNSKVFMWIIRYILKKRYFFSNFYVILSFFV